MSRTRNLLAEDVEGTPYCYNRCPDCGPNPERFTAPFGVGVILIILGCILVPIGITFKLPDVEEVLGPLFLAMGFLMIVVTFVFCIHGVNDARSHRYSTRHRRGSTTGKHNKVTPTDYDDRSKAKASGKQVGFFVPDDTLQLSKKTTNSKSSATSQPDKTGKQAAILAAQKTEQHGATEEIRNPTPEEPTIDEGSQELRRGKTPADRAGPSSPRKLTTLKSKTDDTISYNSPERFISPQATSDTIQLYYTANGVEIASSAAGDKSRGRALSSAATTESDPSEAYSRATYTSESGPEERSLSFLSPAATPSQIGVIPLAVYRTASQEDTDSGIDTPDRKGRRIGPSDYEVPQDVPPSTDVDLRLPNLQQEKTLTDDYTRQIVLPETVGASEIYAM